jgi:phosphate transport system ATP-binding protein
MNLVDLPTDQDWPKSLKAETRALSFSYGSRLALKNLSIPIAEYQITALIGPSGCGKSTFLRCFNRMHDLYAGNRYEGEILLYPDSRNILAREVDPIGADADRHGVSKAEPLSQVHFMKTSPTA